MAIIEKLNGYPILDMPPRMFSLARALIRGNMRGGYRFWSFLMRCGLLNCVVRYELQGAIRNVPIYVPLYRPESSWSAIEILEYEYLVVSAIAGILKKYSYPAHIIDCGADIGIVTTALLRSCQNIKSVDAFEPNQEAWQWLAKTFAALPIKASAYAQGVSDWTGRGLLVRPKENDSAHAAYIEPTPEGDISIVKLDDVVEISDAGIILKIDVEGLEKNVVHGAEGLLKRAPYFIVAFEAHHDVVRRTSIDPCDILNILAAIHSIDVKVAELPDVTIDLSRPFFDQVPSFAGVKGKDILNIICSSRI